MAFRRVENLKTGKIRYYIDGRRVSRYVFESKTDYGKYNSSAVWDRGILRYSVYSC